MYLFKQKEFKKLNYSNNKANAQLHLHELEEVTNDIFLFCMINSLLDNILGTSKVKYYVMSLHAEVKNVTPLLPKYKKKKKK